MSWDIVLFNSRQKITTIETLDPEQLEPTDFCGALESHFEQTVKQGNNREVTGADYSFHYYQHDEHVSNTLLFLYGENALFALVILAKKQGWQIFDTGLGAMIDLENPANNGYENFQRYLQHVLHGK